MTLDASTTASTGFRPPTAQKVQELLAKHSLRPANRWANWAPILIVGGAMLISFRLPEGLSLLVLMGAVVGVMVYVGQRVQRVRDLERRVGQVQELALMRQYPDALRQAWRLFPDLATVAELHHRLAATMAQCLDHVRAHEAALVIHDYLLTRLPEAHPATVQLRVVHAVAKLSSDQLADGDDELRRLRAAGVGQALEDEGHAAAQLSRVTRAGYRFALLLQNIQTNHFDDAIAMAPSLVGWLRPLGVEAGHGYGLMALAYHHLSSRAGTQPEASEAAEGADEDRRSYAADLAEAARQWWSRATLLLPVDALVYRHPVLEDMSQDALIREATQMSVPPEVV